jgi:hypothetical protein
MLNLLLPILGQIGKTVAGNLFPDPKDEIERQRVTNEVNLAVLAQAGAIERAASENIKTEAASQHWLAANWRPLTMVTFVVLIVARWFGYAAPELAPEEYLKLWDIVELGIGGYVVGRSVEKVAPSLIGAFKK